MNTFGWDTVYAASLDTLNHQWYMAQIAGAGGCGTGFDAAFADWKISGQFGPWQLVPGGSGGEAHVCVQFQNGTVQFRDMSPSSLEGVSVIITVQIGELAQADDGSRELRLAFRYADNDPTTRAQPGAVALKTLVAPPGRLDLEQRAGLGKALVETLMRSSDKVAFVLAKLNQVPMDAGTWLSPCSERFAWWGNFLVIFASTSSRDTSGLSIEPDPELLTGAGDTFFAMSAALFLQNVVLPLLPEAFGHGMGPGDFFLDAERGVITNQRSFDLDSVPSGLVYYTPVVDSLTLTLSRSGIHSVMSGHVDAHGDTTMTFTLESEQAFAWDAASGRFLFTADPKPELTATNNDGDKSKLYLDQAWRLAQEGGGKLAQDMGMDTGSPDEDEPELAFSLRPIEKRDDETCRYPRPCPWPPIENPDDEAGMPQNLPPATHQPTRLPPGVEYVGNIQKPDPDDDSWQGTLGGGLMHSPLVDVYTKEARLMVDAPTAIVDLTTAAFAVFGAGFASAFGAIMDKVCQGIASSLTSGTEASALSSLPPQVICWGGLNRFTAQDASLNGDFRMSGTSS